MTNHYQQSSSESAVTRYEVILQEDGDDLILPLPPEMLKKLGWIEGDLINWRKDDHTGAWLLTKK